MLNDKDLKTVSGNGWSFSSVYSVAKYTVEELREKGLCAVFNCPKINPIPEIEPVLPTVGR
mgnify:CR=1 FL=1